MKLTILPGGAKGSLRILPSKSQLHRLLICAALSERETILRSAYTEAEDVEATIACLRALGAVISRREDGFAVIPLRKELLPSRCVLPCGESGTTLRLMLPLVCALGVSGTFHMSGRLPRRPLGPLEEALVRQGISLSRPSPDTLLCAGQLLPGDYVLPGNISSQYISGLLLALPLLAADSRLAIEGPLESAAYVRMTQEALTAFGQGPAEAQNRYQIRGGRAFKSPGAADVEGDWSNAAFWLSAGAMPGGDIRLWGLKRDSSQGDREICGILSKMGAQVKWEGEVLSVSAGKRRAVEIDAASIPDLIPVLAAVAAVSVGTTVVRNAARLRLKESDRLTAVAETLDALGARIQEERDGLVIRGVPQLRGGAVDAWGDHRIAMMAAVASLASQGPVTISGAQAVKKSYPPFWELFKKLGKQLVIEEASGHGQCMEK